MQSDKSKTATSGPTIRQPLLQPKQVHLIGQPLLQTGYQQPGMFVQNVYQSNQIGSQAQRSPNMAVGVYQQQAQMFPGPIVQQVSAPQQTLVPGIRMTYPGQSMPAQGIINTALQVPNIQPVTDSSKAVKMPAMIQPKIPVPLNLPRIQPAHGYPLGNSISSGTPISAQLLPGVNSLPSVAITQIPTPQFFSTPCTMIRSPVSPQFLTHQAHSPQLSPMFPVSPAMFQVQGNPQSTMFTYGTQPPAHATSPMSLATQAVSPVTISPQGNIIFSPATPGLSPTIMVQPSGSDEVSDQPTDLSMKSPRESSKKEQEPPENPEKEVSCDLEKLDSHQDEEMLDDDQERHARSPSFQESFLNLKQRNPASVSATSSGRESPEDDENPFTAITTDDVFANGDATSDEKDADTETRTEKNIDDVALEQSDSEFVWEEYLQETGVQAVPPTAFKHVEFSLQSGFVKGMKLEVPNKCTPGTYWVASVIMTCGPLLRLRYDGYEEDSSADFWCDLATSEIHPIGWCAQNGQNLQPPEAIKFKFSDWKEFLMTALTGARTAPSYLLDKTTGSTPIDQLRPGMRLELQDHQNLLEVWLVKIIENIGGRLYLRLEGVESGSKDFWMFYLHYRLHPVGWARTEEGCIYKAPSSIESDHTESEWEEILDTALKENEEMALPLDIFKDQIEIQPHRFEEGMKLEALHPDNNHIYPATISKVFNSKYFQIEIDDLREPEERSIVRVGYHGNQIGIFPITWCQSQGIRLSPPRGWIKPEFSWGEYLTYCNAKAAPDKCFSLSQHEEHEFERGMKLEAVNPANPNQICASTVTKMAGPLLWIHLDSNVQGMSTYIEAVDSFNLFPVGWCESNGYQLKPPRKISYGRKRQRRISMLEKRDLHGEEYRSQTYQHVKSGDTGDSWCPKIYFNHKCFSGPFLSKGRIAELPKSVGPGPIDLVMKEVLTLLCSVAYVSSRVLKEIEKDGPANPSMHQQVLKAKYKGKSYRAVVEICKKVSQLEEFCRQICIKLECCPYLFSPLLVEDNCPENCMQLTKTKIPYTYGYKKKKKLPVGRPPLHHNRPEHTTADGDPKVPAKRGRKRKRFHLIHKKSHSQKPEEENGNEVDGGSTNGDNKDEGFIDDDRSGEDIDEDNRSLTPPKQPGLRKKYQRHIPAPSDIQTRGAKLPRYTFERRTHKKILLTHSSPPNKVKPKKELPAVSLPPSETKEIYPKLPKNDDLHTDANPLYWSVDDVIEFLKTTDCGHLARIIKEQEIDGQAFLMLSLATIQEHLDLKLGPAVKLCHQIERVKVVFFEKFAK